MDKRTKAGVGLAQTNGFGRLDKGASSAETAAFSIKQKHLEFLIFI